MSMTIINSLPIPASNNFVTKSEDECENKSTFHQLLGEKKDEMAFDTDKEGDVAVPLEQIQANDLPLSLEAVYISKKNSQWVDKETDSDETDDLTPWLIGMGLPVLPKTESVNGSITLASDSPQRTLLEIEHTTQLPAMLMADTVCDGQRVDAFASNFINGLSFENNNINPSLFKNANRPELMSRGSIWNQFSENETHALMTSPQPAELLHPVSLAPTVTLNVPVNSPQWQELLSQQIVFFNKNDIHKAHIRLHPEEFGSLHIQLEMQDGKMHMALAALHSGVKSVLELAVPHLRISLAEQGVDLQSVYVNDNMSMAFHQESSSSFHQSSFSHFRSEDMAETVQTEEQVVTVDMGSGGLSVFA